MEIHIRTHVVAPDLRSSGTGSHEVGARVEVPRIHESRSPRNPLPSEAATPKSGTTIVTAAKVKAKLSVRSAPQLSMAERKPR